MAVEEITIPYRGYAITYPKIPRMGSQFVVNVGSDDPRLAIKLPRAYMVIVDHISIENALNEAKRRIDEALSV